MLNLKWFKKGLTLITIFAIGLPFFNIMLSLFRNGTYTFDLQTLNNPMTYLFIEVANIFNVSSGYVYDIVVYVFSYILFINICLIVLEVLMYVLGFFRKFLEKGGKEI